MTAAHEFWADALGCMAAVVVAICLLAAALHIWERRLTGPIAPDCGCDEYADAAADRADAALIEWNQQAWAEIDGAS